MPRFHHWRFGIYEEAIYVEFLYSFPPSTIACLAPVYMAKKGQPSPRCGINSYPVPGGSIKQISISSKKEIEERMRSVSACNCFSIEYEILPSNDSFDLLTSR